MFIIVKNCSFLSAGVEDHQNGSSGGVSGYIQECNMTVNYVGKTTSAMICPASGTKIHFWSWPILLSVVVLSVLGNLIVIHAITFVRRFHK